MQLVLLSIRRPRFPVQPSSVVDTHCSRSSLPHFDFDAILDPWSYLPGNKHVTTIRCKKEARIEWDPTSYGHSRRSALSLSFRLNLFLRSSPHRYPPTTQCRLQSQAPQTLHSWVPAHRVPPKSPFPIIKSTSAPTIPASTRFCARSPAKQASRLPAASRMNGSSAITALHRSPLC
jgi:hypothetical protein